MKTTLTLSIDSTENYIVEVTFSGSELGKAFSIETDIEKMVSNILGAHENDYPVDIAEMLYNKLCQFFNRTYASTVLKVENVLLLDTLTGFNVEVSNG